MATLNSVGQLLASENRMWAGFVLNLIWGAVLLFFSYLLRHQGALGLSLANLIAYVVHLFTTLIFVRFYILSRNVHDLTRP